MRLHLLGLPHTVTRPDYSHCAFTGKVLRFSPMLRSVGYDVVHYGVEGAESGATEQVDILSAADFERFVGKHDPAAPSFTGNHADASSPLYRIFNARLRVELDKRVESGDVICLPFGHGHAAALAGLDRAYFVETGIGYEQTFTRFRIFESQAWMHWHLGRAYEASPHDNRERGGDDYTWVIPNYFDTSEWEPRYSRGDYLVYFGRIYDGKGLPTVVEIAKQRPDLRVVICGQGDPQPYLAQAPNLEYVPPMWGRARSDLLRHAIAALCPSRYVEPFGGVAVEAMLCGTPVLGSSFGAYTETLAHGTSGFRCRTLGDWLAAVHRAETFSERDRRAVRAHAERYDMYRLAHDYDAAFRQLADLGGAGWYADRAASLGIEPPASPLRLAESA